MIGWPLARVACGRLLSKTPNFGPPHSNSWVDKGKGFLTDYRELVFDSQGISVYKSLNVPFSFPKANKNDHVLFS